MGYLETEPLAFVVIKRLLAEDKLRDLREHGEMRGRVYTTGSILRYVEYMILRTNNLNNKDSYELTRNLSTGETVAESDIDRVIEVSSVLSSLGSDRQGTFKRRKVCLEEGVSERDLKTIEDYTGIHSLSDSAIQIGSIEAMVRVYDFTERAIEDYRREAMEQLRAEARRIFRKR
ncbi:MAG: hypothetical protein AABY10_06300 [Nanoarchaeota archaeon]